MLAQLFPDAQSTDLVALGMQASAIRAEVLGSKVASYTLETSNTPKIVLPPGTDLIQFVSQINPQLTSIIPLCGTGLTAADYLRLVAVCRLTYPALHIEVDLAATGVKVGQIALSFGADDLGSIHEKPGSRFDEEEVRRTIRDAGFDPKRRDASYSYYWID